VTSLLAATGVDRFGQPADGTGRGVHLSQLGGTLVFILVFVPALIAALDALRLEAVSDPARDLLQMFLTAIPHILAAAAIIALAWYIGRFVADLVARLLASLGFDRLPAKLGLAQMFPAQAPDIAASDAGTTLSDFAGRVAFFFIMLFATVEAAHRLGFAG